MHAACAARICEAAPRRSFRIDSTAQTHTESPASVGGLGVYTRRESAARCEPIANLVWRRLKCRVCSSRHGLLFQARTARRPLPLYVQRTASTSTTCCLADTSCPHVSAEPSPQTRRRHGRTLTAPSAHGEIDTRATLSRPAPRAHACARAAVASCSQQLKTRACAAVDPAAAGQSPPPPCSSDALFTSRSSSAHHLRPGPSPSRLGHARARRRSDASASRD